MGENNMCAEPAQYGTGGEDMNTDPAQFQRFLTLIPDEINPHVWFIPLGMGLKSPDIPKGESAKDEKYRLTPEKAHERIKKGINVGIYATPGGLLFLDADTDKGNTSI